MRLGIGVATFNRAGQLGVTLDAVQALTETAHELVVADDGSTDATPSLLDARRIGHIRGPNRGIAWNKNRLLYYLHAVRRCDVVILLEDDTVPSASGWERIWIEAARRWGHANLAGEWFTELYLSGTGTLADPVLCASVSGQCSSFSRTALDACGYMDTRFKRYGYEHSEHSQRLVRSGYGGVTDPERFFLIKADLLVGQGGTQTNHSGLDANAEVFHKVVGQDPTLHRGAWRDPEECTALKQEILAARHLAPRSLALRAMLSAAMLRDRLLPRQRYWRG